MNKDEDKYFREAILSGNVVKGAFINKTKSGQLINIEGSDNPVYNEKGEIVAFLAIQRDISDRKQSEEKLIESEKMNRALLNAPADPVYLIDLEGYLLSINEAGIEKTGKSADKLIGSCLYDFSYMNPLFNNRDMVEQGSMRPLYLPIVNAGD